MKLTIKTLQQSTFTVEMEPDKTVKELKEKIEREQGKEYPCSAQKLIYSGKILADENKLSEYEFDEKKFVVLMVTRPPPAPKVAPNETKTESKSAPDEKSKQTAPPSTLATSSTTTTATPSTATASTTRQQTTATTTESRPQRQPQPPSSGRASALSDMSALSMGEPQVTARLAALMTQPHFRQIQDLIQQSPHLLSSTIESLSASDPEMYNFISENPDVFVSALNHPPLADIRRTNTSQSSTTLAGQQQSQASRAGSQQTSGAPGGRQQPVVDQILGDVSERDKEAIERLKELGFSEYLAVQAYMACDKDEQLAANLLFQMDQ